LERLNPATGLPWKYGDIASDGKVFIAHRRKEPLTKEGFYRTNWTTGEGWERRKEYCLETSSTRRKKNLDLVQAEKMKRGCLCCGYKEDPCALDFDHLDPNKKHAGVGRMMTHSFDKILDEMDKCQLLCANCHRIKTHNPKKFKAMLANAESVKGAFDY
jgi:5-methylcytosine-specific restriction endonuclease McrA